MRLATRDQSQVRVWLSSPLLKAPYLRKGNIATPMFNSQFPSDKNWELNIGVAIFPLLPAQSESKQRIADCYADILLSVDGEAHRTRGNGRPEICLPEKLAITRVQSVEGPVAAPA